MKHYLAIDLGEHSGYKARNSKEDSNTNYVEKTKKYLLAKFPRNYVFHVHQRVLHKEKKPRYDCYLAGMLSNSVFPLSTHS